MDLIQLADQGVLTGKSWEAFRALHGGAIDGPVMSRIAGHYEALEKVRAKRTLERAWHDENIFANVQGGAETFVDSIRIGTGKRTETLGGFLFRRVVVGSPNFKYRKYHLERFERSDTRRPMNAPFRYKSRQYETLTGSLERRGFASMLDRDEIAAADAANAILGAGGINLRSDYAMLSRDEVENDLEYVRAQEVLDAANYGAGLNTTVGTAWDAVGGDSRADIQTIAQALAAKHGVSIRDIGVVLTDDALEAALNDPTFLGKLETSGTINWPQLGDLASYWGVGQVVNRDAYYTTDGDALTSHYGDVAVLYVIPSRLAGFDSRESSFDAFVEFSWNPAGGLALTPVYKGVEINGAATTWLFPWESWATPANVSDVGAAILRGVKA